MSKQDPVLHQAFQRAGADDSLKKNILTYVSDQTDASSIFNETEHCFQAFYGRSNLLSDLGAAARNSVKNGYPFDGSIKNIASYAKFLLQDGTFLYGDVDVKVSDTSCCQLQILKLPIFRTASTILMTHLERRL
jgi:hypothetical protein